jgi:hypothetical protein
MPNFRNRFEHAVGLHWNVKKIETSAAHYWALVLIGSKTRSRDYVVIKPADLLKQLDRTQSKAGKFQVYIWVTEKERCWETRGLSKSDQMGIATDAFVSAERDFTAYLNNWKMVQALSQ